MMTAFTHSSRATNTWTPNAPRDPTTDTFADPTIWQSNEFSYKQAKAAADYANDASQAKDQDEFRKLVI